MSTTGTLGTIIGRSRTHYNTLNTHSIKHTRVTSSFEPVWINLRLKETLFVHLTDAVELFIGYDMPVSSLCPLWLMC